MAKAQDVNGMTTLKLCSQTESTLFKLRVNEYKLFDQQLTEGIEHRKKDEGERLNQKATEQERQTLAKEAK